MAGIKASLLGRLSEPATPIQTQPSDQVAGRPMVETEFGDTLPAPKAQTQVPTVEQPDRRTQIRREIEAQQNSIDSVYWANIERWREEKAVADRWPVFGVGRMGVPLSRVDTRPEAQKQLAAAAAELKRARATTETYTEAEQEQDEAKGHGKSWLSQLWNGATNLSPDKAADILTAGMASTVIDNRINPILEKASRGETLTEYERAVVAARGVAQNAQRHVADQGGATTAYSIGESLPGTAQFMVETAATGGSMGVGKAVAGGAWKAIGKAAAKEAARTPFRGSMWQDLEERTGDQYFVRDDGTVDKEETSAVARLYKSYMSTFAEGFSEQLGNVVGSGLLAKGAEKLAPKLLGKEVGGALVGGVERLAKATEGVRDVFRRTTNYNGTFDEFGEEVVSNIIEPILTGEPERIKENFSSKNLLTTLGSVALVGSVMHAAELPSVARYYAQDGKLRKQTNQAVAAINDPALRQGVFDALKKGQTVEQKAAQLSSLTWDNVSPADAAHVVDAFSSNLRHELFKGVDQEQTAQEEYARQYSAFNAEYGQISRRDTGTVQELLDDEGNSYYLLAGSIGGASADNTVFVLDAQTGETGQLDRNRIEHVEPPLTYGQLLNKFNAQNIEPEISEFDDVDTDATEAGVGPVGYAQGEAVDLSDGRSGEFIGYLPDGATAQIAVLDEQTNEPITVDVHRNQIVGLSDVATAVVAPIAEQEVLQTTQTPTVPLQEDGTPDYEAMTAGQFLEEYGKAYSPQEAVAELESESKLLGKQIEKIKKGGKSLDRNAREKNRRKIAELQIRLDDIVSVLGTQPTQTIDPPAEFVVEPTQKEQVFGFGDPVSLRDYILREIVQGKRFRWKDDGVRRGLASELGFADKEGERRVRIGLLKNDGDTPEGYAEHLTAEVAPQFGMTDYGTVFDEVLDVLLSVNSKGQAFAQLNELHDNRPDRIEAERAEYLQGQANKETYDAQVEMDQNYDRLSIEDFDSIDALFSEESLPLYQDDNTERVPQQPSARTAEAAGYAYDERDDAGRTQGDFGQGSVAGADRGRAVQSGTIGPAGSRGSGNAAESIQQPDGITQSATADLSEVRFSESNSDYTPEMERIKSDAIERGDFMRPPNGNPTHLTERQWLQVRTAPFKEWFGDWEHAARIEKLRAAEPVSITGNEITPSDDLKQYRRNAFEYGKQIRGAYVNQHTGEVIVVSRSGLEEVLHHDAAKIDHLQSVAAIPQIIEQATYITSEPNTDTKVKADQFRYYVCGLKIGGVDHTVKIVVAEIDGKRYYDHALTKIEKSNLIDLIRISSLNQEDEIALSMGFKPTGDAPTPSYAQYKDKRLLSILQADASKIVDANGEPLVVYHGTNNEFYRFNDTPRLGFDPGVYFTTKEEVAKQYGKYVLSVFVNSKKPKTIDVDDLSFNESYDKDLAGVFGSLGRFGVDGLIIHNIYDHPSGKRKGHKASTIVVYDANQVKSAIENAGEFNTQTDDIRFQQDVFAEQAFAEIEHQQQYEANKLQQEQSSAERRATIDRTLQKLTQEFGVETVQVDTAAELPAPLRAATKGRWPAGLYHKPSGTVYVIASELRDADHATATYLHEVVAHKGIDGLLGQERAARFYAAVFDALKPKEQARLLERYGSKEIAGDEVVARMAEGDVTPGTMQRIVAAVRRFFREVLGVPLTISDTDIRYILFKSKISLQRTANLADAMKAIEADQRMRKVVALDELRAKERAPLEQVNDQFNDEIHRLENGTLPKHYIFALGYPDQALLAAGVPCMPVELSSDRLLRKSQQKEHQFELGSVRNLPEALAHPIAVFDSKRGVDNKVVLTELLDGSRHFVAVIQTAHSIQRGRDIVEINDIQSIYPKDARKIEHWIKGGLMRWVDKEKALGFLAAQWPNYIGGEQANEGPNASGIRRSNSADATSPDRFDPARALVEKPNELASADHSDLVGTAKIVQNFENPTFEDDIRYSEVKPLRQPIPHRVAGNKGRFGDKGRIGKAVEQIGSAAVQVQEALQDATIKVHLLQNEVTQGGGTITPLTNVYEALNHVDSRADAAMRKYKRHFMNPIVDHIKRWRKAYGLGYDEVTDYLLAKHSLERHASGINALDEKEGGKWTKEHATQQVEAVESVVPEAELTAFWADWRKATHQVLEISVRSGRMSLDEKREILGNGWQYYVPLRGKDFDFEEVADMRDVFYYEMNRGQGGASVSERIAEVKAKGRSSKSADPIAMLQYMANNEIFLSEQNNARRTLLRLVEAHPERTDLFSVRYKWYVKQPDGSWTGSYKKPAAELLSQTGRARALLRTEKDHAKRQELKDQITVSLREREVGTAYTGAPEGANAVSVMKDGIRYTVELVDPEVAAAVNYKAGSVQRWASKYIGTPTRIMAQLSTSKNPAFILPNFVRDMEQAALYNFTDSEGNTLGFMRHALGSWKILNRNLRGVDRPLTVAELGTLDVTNPADHAQLIEQYGKDRVNDTLYDLFAANGGETGYVHIADPKDYQRKLEKEIQTAAGGNVPRKTWKAINTGIDYLAAMSENAVRYATFVSQLETGKSVFDAVSYAKNITVNFNRKGKYTKGIGALFMFFNASVQAVVNKYSLWGNKKGKTKKQMRAQRVRFIASQAALTALGYWSAAMVAELIGSLLGDDGAEYAVSDYERRTNFIIPMPGTEKGYVKIPVSVSERPFYALGVMVCDWVNGKLESDEVLSEFVQVAADSFSPLPVDYSIDKDNAWSLAKPLIPSPIKPLAEIGYNENFAGLPINRTSFNPNTPDSELGMKNASSLSKAITAWLNRLGGGNEITPAGTRSDGTKNWRNALDISPSTLDHLVSQYAGGIGRIITETITTLNPETREARKIPIVNRFYSEAYAKRPSQEYYDLKRRIEFVDKNNRDSKMLGIESALFAPEELEQKTAEYRRLRNRLRTVEKKIRSIKEGMEELPGGSEAYQEREAEIQRIQREFIQEYNQQDHD